jgi:hypothetical protein
MHVVAQPISERTSTPLTIQRQAKRVAHRAVMILGSQLDEDIELQAQRAGSTWKRGGAYAVRFCA